MRRCSGSLGEIDGDASSRPTTSEEGSAVLQDAGVPLKSLVAGLSIGLVTSSGSGAGVLSEQKDEVAKGNEINDFVLLKDILGSEDHHGDMDFKIAGSSNGITAIQLDVKLEGGLPLDILIQALALARDGRQEILELMYDSVWTKSSHMKTFGQTKHSLPRQAIKSFAPRAEIVQCDEERRSKLIGERGETINYIREMFDCEVDMDEDGSVYVYGKDSRLVAEAAEIVRDIAVTVKEVGSLPPSSSLHISIPSLFISLSLRYM